MVAAAGSGERLGAGGPKALVEVAGRPLVAWCLDALGAAASVARAVIAAPPGREEELAAAAAGAAGELRVEVVAGAASRSGSVAAALARVDSELVLVHDAARPLVTAELVDAVLATLAGRADVAGVIAAAPITDTVKRAEGPRPPGGPAAREAVRIAATESRDLLWAAQTPQAFRTAALRDAHAADPDQGIGATDDAILVERAGGAVLIHPAPAENIKVTTPHDLRVAGLLLAGGRRGGSEPAAGR